MKKNIQSAELTGDSLNQYIQKLKKAVERELSDEAVAFDWDMDDNKVYLSIDFTDGSPATFAFDAWRFTGERAYFDYDVDIIVGTVLRYMQDRGINGHLPDTFEFIKSKSVLDSDGFQTDYTMYYDIVKDRYVFIFGDNDVYTPETADFDWDCETREEADEWFDSYTGPGEYDEDSWIDDIEECQDIMSDWNIEDQIDAPDAIGKLNPGDKFVNRNGVVVEIIEPDRLGHIQFKIGDEVKSGNEKSIQQMLYRNNYMRKIETSQEFVDMGTGLEYWYFTTHGVQPGSVPKCLNIIKIVDAPEGSYFLTDRVITTKALHEYDIKERAPKDVEASNVPGGRYWEPGWEDANDEDAPYIHITADSWDEFIQEIEEETGLKLDSAYKRRHRGDDYFEFVDDLGNTFSATYTQYNDGSFEFRGESLKTL